MKKIGEEIVLLKDIFKKNEHPQCFIDKCIKNCVSKFFVSKGLIHTVDKKLSLVGFTFFRLSEIRSRLQKLFIDDIPNHTIVIDNAPLTHFSPVSHFYNP